MCPLRSRRAARGRGRGAAAAAGGEGAAAAPTPAPLARFCAEGGSPARRHVNWISFTPGGGKAQGLGLQQRLGRFIQGFIDKKKKKEETGQAGCAHAGTHTYTDTLLHTYIHLHAHTLTHTRRGCFCLPVTPPPPGAGEAARGGCVIHFPGAEGDKLCGVGGVQPACRASRMPL